MRKFLFGLVLLLAVPGTSRAYTTAFDVEQRARIYLRDQSTSPNRQQFPSSTLWQFMSDGMREANAQNWLFQSSFTLTLVGGTTEYALPNDFMAVTRAWYQQPNQPYIKLIATSMDQLDAQSSGWIQANGIPTSYYIDKSPPPINAIGTPSNYTIGFYPAPISSSTGPVVVYYAQQSLDTAYSSQGQIWNGNLAYQPYMSALAYYVAARGFMAVEETDLAEMYMKLWENFLYLQHQGMAKTPDFNPGFIGQHGSP